ncbi:Hypothetical_protein [Hexamita inflata]|uniref:Hypothetical_protein n=1 Tax=Hexamita inflata TaxID=28002 RepID=A0ABP1IZ08_9EUKA
MKNSEYVRNIMKIICNTIHENKQEDWDFNQMREIILRNNLNTLIQYQRKQTLFGDAINSLNVPRQKVSHDYIEVILPMCQLKFPPQFIQQVCNLVSELDIQEERESVVFQEVKYGLQSIFNPKLFDFIGMRQRVIAQRRKQTSRFVLMPEFRFKLKLCVEIYENVRKQLIIEQNKFINFEITINQLEDNVNQLLTFVDQQTNKNQEEELKNLINKLYDQEELKESCIPDNILITNEELTKLINQLNK